MNIAIDLATTLAATVFLIIGGIKIFYTRGYMAESKWVKDRDSTVAGVRVMGVSQVVAALALAIPTINGFGEPIVPIVAAGVLVANQIAALILNARSRDWREVAISGAYILLPAFLVFAYATGTEASVNWA